MQRSTVVETSAARAEYRQYEPVPESAAARWARERFARAGIRINGSGATDLRVYDHRFYTRLLRDGVLAMGESYMDGWWDAPALDGFFTQVLTAGLPDQTPRFGDYWLALKARLINRQNRHRADRVSRRHYDLGNDLYEAMLDPNMQYTCAYWRDANDLDAAQEAKLHLLARKLGLSPGMSVLDLGGGFGGTARFLAREYGCSVVMYNISTEQVSYARRICSGLPVRIEHRDYREAITEPAAFDRVIAIGLCEHVGPRNYRSFLELVHRCLRDRGLFLLHTIGANRTHNITDPWIDKYIFPGGVIPSMARLAEAAEGIWVIEDWHNFGPDYDRTLMAWWENFDRAWPELEPAYGERFRRMWKYYLHGSAASFRARKLQLWQLVMSKGDVPSYTPVR